MPTQRKRYWFGRQGSGTISDIINIAFYCNWNPIWRDFIILYLSTQNFWQKQIYLCWLGRTGRFKCSFYTKVQLLPDGILITKESEVNFLKYCSTSWSAISIHFFLSWHKHNLFWYIFWQKYFEWWKKIRIFLWKNNTTKVNKCLLDSFYRLTLIFYHSLIIPHDILLSSFKAFHASSSYLRHHRLYYLLRLLVDCHTRYW